MISREAEEPGRHYRQYAEFTRPGAKAQKFIEGDVAVMLISYVCVDQDVDVNAVHRCLGLRRASRERLRCR